MTRNQIEMEYRIENGRIQNAGKFEGEPLWTPYFYSLSLNGGANDSFIEEDYEYTLFVITENDKKFFPELKDANRVILRNDDNGFIYGKILD